MVQRWSKVIALVALVSMMLCACGEDVSELSSSDKVTYTQLSNNYVKEVEYEQENNEEITNCVVRLCQAYIMNEEQFKIDCGDLEDKVEPSVWSYFVNVAREYPSYERYDVVESTKEQYLESGSEYKANAIISYTRDCMIVHVSYDNQACRLKMTYDDDKISSIIDYCN